jgi:hypothetical protein
MLTKAAGALTSWLSGANEELIANTVIQISSHPILLIAYPISKTGEWS